MALEIGRILIQRDVRIAALVAELQMYRDSRGQHLPWPENVQNTVQSPELAYESERRTQELSEALDAATPDDSAMRVLHRHLVRE
jgi:hypothetical protein